jgi:hypothetical protein
MQRSKEINDARNVEPEPISISLALPLLIAAADESRDDLVDVWARLLAAAADPKRTGKFRSRFIEIARQLDPVDAAVMQAVAKWGDGLSDGDRNRLVQPTVVSLGLSSDEFDVSRENLTRLGLLNPPHPLHTLRPSALGREFLRAVND